VPVGEGLSEAVSLLVPVAEGVADSDMDSDTVPEEEAEAPDAKPVAAEKPKSKSRNSKMVDEEARYGESLLREMLGAEPVEDKKNGR
jgi:DNA polymerase-3 subunit gamma/tau